MFIVIEGLAGAGTTTLTALKDQARPQTAAERASSIPWGPSGKAFT